MAILIGLGVLLLLLVVGVLIAALPLHLSVKFFGVGDSRFGQAVQVTLMAWLISLVIGTAMTFVGFVVPFLPHFVTVIAPFAVYVLLVQTTYSLSLGSALIVGVIQWLVSTALAVALTFVGVTLLLSLGIGTAVLQSLHLH